MSTNDPAYNNSTPQSEPQDLKRPIAREGESQYACILRNRSGVDAGCIDFGLRTAAVMELTDRDKEDITNTAFALYECICNATNRKAARDLMQGGIDQIARERARQVKQEGWTAAHDDTHKAGELGVAAAELVLDAHMDVEHELEARGFNWDMCGSLVKYGKEGTKPDRIRCLVIAGALIAAEIDRLQRLG